MYDCNSVIESLLASLSVGIEIIEYFPLKLAMDRVLRRNFIRALVDVVLDQVTSNERPPYHYFESNVMIHDEQDINTQKDINSPPPVLTTKER